MIYEHASHFLFPWPEDLPFSETDMEGRASKFRASVVGGALYYDDIDGASQS